MNREDLQTLRVPLIVLALTMVAAVSIVFVSAAFRDQAKTSLTQRETQLREARLRILNAGEERERIIRYVSSYQQLARSGLVGDEQRINWLDGLRLAHQEAQIFGVEYDIGVQKPYAYAAEFDIGKLSLQESVMRLRFRLLHEEDLPRFFRALSQHGVGFFTVDQCVMRRQTGKEFEKGAQFQPNLGAECDVRWLTIKPAPPAEKKK